VSVKRMTKLPARVHSVISTFRKEGSIAC